MKKILLFLFFAFFLSQLRSQNSFSLRKVIFLDLELDVKGDTSDYHISIYSNFPPTDYRFLFIEFAVDSQIISKTEQPFSLFLYSYASNDSILLEICDTLSYENSKAIMRAYCAIHTRDIPGGQDKILNDIRYDYIHLMDTLKNNFVILHYDKCTKSFTNIIIPQIEAISPRLPNPQKIKFRKCYCPPKALFNIKLMPLEEE